MERRDTDMMPAAVPLMFSGKTYQLIFNMNTIDAICAEFGCQVRDIPELIKDSTTDGFRENVKKYLVILMNEYVDIHNEECPDDEWKPVTIKQLNRKMTELAFAEAYNTIITCYIRSFIRTTYKDEDDIGEDDPNVVSGAT